MQDPLQLRLPHSLLLFRGKVLTFGEGVALKMAITQWQQWAATQVWLAGWMYVRFVGILLISKCMYVLWGGARFTIIHFVRV